MNDLWDNIIEALTIYLLAPVAICILSVIFAFLLVGIPYGLLAVGVWAGNGNPHICAAVSFSLLALVIVLCAVVYTFLERGSKK